MEQMKIEWSFVRHGFILIPPLAGERTPSSVTSKR